MNPIFRTYRTEQDFWRMRDFLRILYGQPTPSGIPPAVIQLSLWSTRDARTCASSVLLSQGWKQRSP